MAVATQRLVSLIEQQADVEALVTSAGSQRGLLRHPTRVARTVRAIVRMKSARQRSDALYAGSDAGLGMLYTLAVVLAGRIMRYRVFLHHHSAAYVHTWSPLMAAIVRYGGACCTHVLSCEGQARGFDARYRPRLPSLVVPISFALGQGDGPSEDESLTARPDGSPLVLGHLSNLSVEKGLGRVFETLQSAVAAGLDARLVMAGPAATARDKAVLDNLLAGAQPHAVYLGLADDAVKRQFLASVDVFLFPSRYRHESFGLVAAEAMQAGVPVIAYRAGCLDAEYVGGGGLVLEPDEDYAELAVQQLLRWARHPEDWQASASVARSRVSRAREEGIAAAAAFVEVLLGGRGLNERSSG